MKSSNIGRKHLQNRQGYSWKSSKKNVTKNKYINYKLTKLENRNEICNQIKNNIKMEAITTNKF